MTGSIVPIRPDAARTHRLAVTGQLAHDTAPALEAALDELCDEGIGELVLDLGELERVDGSGVRVLALRCDLCRRRGVAVRVERLGGAVRAAFAAAGMLGRLPVAVPRPREQRRVHENPQRKQRNIV